MGKMTTKVWLLLPREFTQPLSLSHLSGLYREQSANKISCLEEQPISVPSMSVKGKGRLITCAKEQFWVLRPYMAVFMCWETSLAFKQVTAHKLPLENAPCNALTPAPGIYLGRVSAGLNQNRARDHLNTSQVYTTQLLSLLNLLTQV